MRCLMWTVALCSLLLWLRAVAWHHAADHATIPRPLLRHREDNTAKYRYIRYTRYTGRTTRPSTPTSRPCYRAPSRQA